MKKVIFILIAIVCFSSVRVKADEGMWLLMMMQEKSLTDRMKAQGLKMDPTEIYSPDKVTLKDAVGIFGSGCTGEIISQDGLVLTNHHCGFGAIQYHSSVEHDYLTNGFWAKSRSEELATPGLSFTYVERIEDITDEVNAKIKAGEVSEEGALGGQFLNNFAQEKLKQSDLNGKKGIRAQALPFYAGNKYYLFFLKTYRDVRMVLAPPQIVGKFGGETDNWMWPRHTCDFAIFRIYGDENGEPSDYKETNVPLKVKKYLPISLKGVKEGDYSMIMGFPGSTSRYLTKSEVVQRMASINVPRIIIRGERQDVLKEEMAKSDKVRIQYASKYARSSNYWKNSIGMNKALVDNKVLEAKADLEARFAKFAAEKGNADYANVVKLIDEKVEASSTDLYLLNCFSETFSAIELSCPTATLDSLKVALQAKNADKVKTFTEQLKKAYNRIHNKDYDHEVDRKVAKALIPLYKELANAEYLPSFYETIINDFKGNVDAYVDNVYDNSIFANETNFNKFISKPSVKAIDKDPLKKQVESYMEVREMSKKLTESLKGMDLLHKTYVRGLCEMLAPVAQSPDANFTMRMTYGNVKSYNPKDGVHYNYYTTLKGVMEKENPEDPEFMVPDKLKKLYATKDFGRYAMPNGEMPTCFLTTNDITGGNSGSPVINGNGELIGCAFDGNWESLSSDINFDKNLQRCIAVDIRYILFIIDKFGDCGYLLDEMKLIQ